MAISDIIMWTVVFILATGFVTVVSTAVLLRRAKRRPQDPDEPTMSARSESDDDDWKKDDWNHDDWKKGDWKD